MINRRQCNDKTDEELVGLAVNHQDYFGCLIERYQFKLTNYIRKITNLPDEEVEDVLQDVFIKVYKNLNNFDSDLKFSSWIYRITHNQVISNHRKLKARPQTILIDTDDSSDFLANLASSIDTGQEADLSYLSKNINKVLNKMDLKYREVLILKFLEEKDYKEISDILKKPINTIGTLISRAKDKFRKELKESNINF